MTAPTKLENLLNLALNSAEDEREKSLNLNVGYDPLDREWDLIIKYSVNLDRVRKIASKVTELQNEYAVIRITESRIDILSGIPEVENVEKPKRLFFQAAEGRRVSCINAVQDTRLSLYGQGILVAIIDSGIDYANIDFRNADGSTRIRYLWDQSLNPADGETAPVGYSIGVEYTKGQIDEALNAQTVSEQRRLVRSQDISGHGTAVAGVAAGNGSNSGGRYAGVAMQSELIVVKLGNPIQDTLDTWFSSALWPFSTLGWPNEDSEDLKYFYPTNTLVTGYDIIGFWVSRMIFSGLAYTGKAPFSTVCIHGIVRDSQGRKMSKSLGNGIDPLEVIAQYGADALRFMLLDGSTPGNDMRYSEKKVEAARNFANKLWNATRFVLMNLPEDFEPGLPSEDKLDMSDKWVLTKLNQVAGAMTDNLDHYEMGLAAAKINSFIWDVYCDWFIEIAKPRLNSGDAEQADTARRVLVYVLDKALKLLHPFMPFITEELYQALPGSGESIMIQSWPTFDEAHNWAAEEEAFEKVMDYIKAVRTMRTEMNVHPAKKTSMIIETADAAPFRNAQVYLAKFAFATDVTFTEKYEGSTDGMVQVSTHAARGFIPMMELIDRDKELARLNKEKAKAEKELAMFGNQLNNPKFVERAPAALVEDIRAKYAKSQDKLANIEQSIQALG